MTLVKERISHKCNSCERINIVNIRLGFPIAFCYDDGSIEKCSMWSLRV